MMTPVSNFRHSFPHTRGGGPQLSERRAAVQSFSPHAWGWTLLAIRQLLRSIVFPTRVGVDLCFRHFDV